MVDGIPYHQPRGWRRHLFYPVGHHTVHQQRRRNLAILGLGWLDDFLVSPSALSPRGFWLTY